MIEDNDRCPSGSYNCAGQDPIDTDGDKFFRCMSCHKDKRKQAMDKGVVNPFYVVAHHIDRCYGGPEEGGWYYDATEILQVRKVWDWKSALKVMRELRAEYPQPRYNRFSVLGREGDYFVRMYYDTDQFPRETTERPRYE